MAQTHTLRIDLAAILGPIMPGSDYFELTTNLPAGAALMDKTQKRVHLPVGRIAFDSDGVAEIDLIDTSATDLNIPPGDLQYRVSGHATAAGGHRAQRSWNSGWFHFTADADITELDLDVPGVTPSWRSAFAAEMEQVKDAVAADRAYVEGIIITDLGTTDGQTKALIETPSSQTAGALNAAITKQVAALAINVRDYGAACDNTTDDTAAIQAAIDAAPEGATILFPGLSRITAALSVTKALTLTSPNKVRCGINQAADNTPGVAASAPVTVRSMTLRRPAAPTAHQPASEGISAVGAAGSEVPDVLVEDCLIFNWARTGIAANHIAAANFRNNKIFDCWYAGILTKSHAGGQIAGNQISNIFGATTGLAYGIALSRDNADDLITSPPSSDVTVIGNTIDGVPNWEGLDTHGGHRINFIGNTVRNCYRGIMVGGADNAANVETFGAKDCKVIGNTVDSGKTDGSTVAGIHIIGAGPSGAIVDYTSGTVVSGNTVRGHGAQSANTNGAITLSGTENSAVVGNTIIEPSSFGVCLYYDNLNFTVAANVIVDAWSTDTPIPSAIATRGPRNYGFIGGGNRLAAGTKTAAYLNVRGVYLTSGLGAITLGENDMDAATNPLNDTGGMSQMRFRTNKMGFFNTVPAAKPVLSYSRSGESAQTAAIRTALATLGLVTDSTTA